MAIILDTGPLVALLDQDDAAHDRCVLLLQHTSEVRLIPAPVLVEVDHLSRSYFGRIAFHTLLQDVAEGAYGIVNLEPDDFLRVSDLIQRYEDSPIGFVDAAVLAIVERLNEPKLATLDHQHFGMMRPRHVEALKLLPEL